MPLASELSDPLLLVVVVEALVVFDIGVGGTVVGVVVAASGP